MITYNDIYEAAKKEGTSENLQQLPKNFISEVANYLNEKKQIASKPVDEENSFSDVVNKTKKQLENATTLFKELMRKRRKKILHLVLIASETGISKGDFENMFDMEKELFEKIIELIEKSGKKLDRMLNGNNHKNMQSVEFKEDVAEFVGMDGKTLGGFKKGDVTELPEEIAKILVDSGKAKVV